MTYEYNSLFSLFSQDFSNWSYAADHVYLSPSAWIDGTGPEGRGAARPPAYVATQLQAFRNWGMGGEFADFAYAPLDDFDYGPYVSAMQAAAPGTVESTPPTLAILNQQTTGNVVSLSGTASDSYAIRDVSFTSSSGPQAPPLRAGRSIPKLLDRVCEPHELERTKHRAATR